MKRNPGVLSSVGLGQIMKTQTIEVRAKDPTAKILLKSALKWIRRIEERSEYLPTSFLDNCDPKPLRKEIERYLA